MTAGKGVPGGIQAWVPASAGMTARGMSSGSFPPRCSVRLLPSRGRYPCTAFMYAANPRSRVSTNVSPVGA